MMIFCYFFIQFFMRATSLEQITSDYYFVMEQKDIALAILEKKEQVQSMSGKINKQTINSWNRNDGNGPVVLTIRIFLRCTQTNK